MKNNLLLFLSFIPMFLSAQMEEGSVWKLTGNAAAFLEQNNIDSTKVHFLASGVFLITYESAGTDYTETSTWTEPTVGSIDFTYDPGGYFFGNNCPTENTTFDYSIMSNAFTMTNVGGTCSIAQGLLANSTWVKQGTNSFDENEQVLISVFPNPASDKLVVSSFPLQELKVYDSFGNKLDCKITTISSNRIELDVAELTPGIYVVRTSAGASKKFIVK